MGEGSLKLSLFSLGLLLSASTSLGDLYLKDEPFYWPILGAVLFGVSILVIAPISELLAKKNVYFLLLLSLFAGVALSLCLYFLHSEIPKGPPKKTSQLLPSKVLIENSSILVYQENDCVQDLSINDTDFTNCSLSCPLDLRICETFNYMILCISDGNDIHFSKELKLIQVSSDRNESCGSEYKLRYADRVDMELAPGCTLECTTIASWTDLIPSVEIDMDYKEFKIAYGAAMVLIFTLILIVHGDFLVRGEFLMLGDKYAYFLLGSVLLHSVTPYMAEIPGKMSVYLSIPLIVTVFVFISSISYHQQRRHISPSRRLKTVHVCKQVKSLISHHKLSLIQAAVISLSMGIISSWETNEFYSHDSLLIALHNTQGTIIALPLIAFLGDYLIKQLGSSTCFSVSLLAYGLEFIAYGTLTALPFAVLHFLLSPLSLGFGSFVILKFAHVSFGEELQLPTYGFLSFLGLPFIGRSLGGTFIQGMTWVYVGSSLLLLFILIHFLKFKWNRRKLLPSSDISEHI